MKEIVKTLCADRGISGHELEMFLAIRSLLDGIATVTHDNAGNVVAQMGNPDADNHIMLDAHLDRIGLTATYINEDGFIKAEPVGGIDLRTLPGSPVTVLGTEKITGVICTMPPHLAKDDELSHDKIWVDTGLSAEQVRSVVSLGDSIIVYSQFRELLNDRVAVSALDNRSGCAVLIRTAQLLKDTDLPCKLSLVFSVQEETSELGAATSAFTLAPDEAVVVDVGFAKQDGVPSQSSGELGCGGIISIAPILSRAITDTLIDISKRLNLKCDYEVTGGSTGTNADKIATSRGGVPCGVISIPEKNMHTQTEIVDLNDMESIAQILSIYVKEGGIHHA